MLLIAACLAPVVAGTGASPATLPACASVVFGLALFVTIARLVVLLWRLGRPLSQREREGDVGEELLLDGPCRDVAPTDRTEAAVARRMDSGIALQVSHGPRLRGDWEKRLTPDQDHLRGQVTTQERLWGVLVTMGIAGMRTQVLLDGDVLWYVLMFFCFYDTVMASIMYSSRFNDTDIFHRTLWSAFAFGMAGQNACLNEDLRGVAACTGFMYFLIACGQLRVAVYLPKARFLALHDSLFNMLAMFLCAMTFIIAGLQGERSRHVVLLLGGHACLRPLAFLSFWFLTRSAQLKDSRDVPVNIWYMLSRFEGLYMMIIVCSLLFPLGLQGANFLASRWTAMEVLLGNLWALLLKLSIMDVTDRAHPEELQYHAIRFGSRMRALVYILVFPYGVLGIALAGLGWVAAPSGAASAKARGLLCGGASLLRLTNTLADACHGNPAPRVHTVRVLAQLVGAAVLLVPWCFGFSILTTEVFLVLEMAAHLGLQLFLECLRCSSNGRPKIPCAWRWRPPRLLMPEHGPGPVGSGDDKVSSQEHFFTVLLAVAVLKLNIDIGADHDVVRYVLRLLTFYFVVGSTIRYAARFKAEDLSHKLVWSAFELVLLLMLEGASGFGLLAERFYVFSCGCMFLVLVILFSGRAIWNVPESRPFCAFFGCLHTLCACLCFARLSALIDHGDDDHKAYVMMVVALFLADAGAVLLQMIFKQCFVIPRMSHEYLVNRTDGLFMEVLGVAVIVPNAIFPGAFKHSRLVAIGDVLAIKLAVSIKAAIFDVEPVCQKRHAVNQGPFRSLLYYWATLFTIVSLALFGASIPLSIKSAGIGGMTAYDRFSQETLCAASFMIWMSLSMAKFAHRHATNKRIHMVKAWAQVAGALLSTLPLMVPLPDFVVLCLVTIIAQAMEWTQYWLCCGCLT